LDAEFVVYDDSDQMTLIKECLSQLNLDEKNYPPRNVLSFISRAKEELVDPRSFSQHYQGHFESVVNRVYALYQEKLKLNKALDFDDLIMMTVRLLDQCEEVRLKYQSRFRYVLVDEYQDINYSQYMLVKHLSDMHKNLCVVGDDDQSIYAWRGADVRLIRQFSSDYPNAAKIVLDQNNRSTKTILEAAYHIVKHNRHRTDKKLWTENDEGKLIELYEASDEHDEAMFAFNTINDIVRRGVRKLSEFAILYRTNAQSRVLEDILMSYGMPYKVIGGTRFYERKEIKDIIAYLRLVHNPNDSISLKRIINVPARGIGTVSWLKLTEYAEGHGIPVYEAMHHIDQIQGMSRCAVAIKDFVKLLDELNAKQGELASPLCSSAFSHYGRDNPRHRIKPPQIVSARRGQGHPTNYQQPSDK
jgi:DNA helicase-2/ATP-dependent DNA helicase PcrA